MSDALTAREREVLAEAAKGLSSKEIARNIGCAPRTVDGHLRKLYEKLGARNRYRLIAMCRETT